LFKQHALLIAGQVAGIGDIGASEVFLEEGAIGSDARILLPFWIIGVLVGRAYNDADRIFQARRL